MRRPAVVGIVGYSGSGKTTLLESLIPALAERGLAVGAVKRTSHGFEADRPGKDSHRLYGAGADAVALVSDEQVAAFTRRTSPKPVALSEALAALPDGLDLVLVEGFSWEPIPRVVVVQGARTPASEHTRPGPVLAVLRLAAPRDGEKPDIPGERLASLVSAIARRARPAEAAAAEQGAA
jgi:molybdopterin-guanine dinucleotide biosynthesis protein B